MTDQQKSLLISEINYPKAKELADLGSLLQDLDTCIQTCQRLMDSLDANNEDMIYQGSLWTTALIVYARCFSSGKRFGISEEFLRGLNGDPIGAHRYYIGMRDKNIAHSVNPFEQIKIGLVLNDPKNKKSVIGIVNLSQRHLTAKKDGVDTLRRLCIVIRKKLAIKWKLCQEETLKIGKALPVDDLYGKSHMQIVTAGPDEAGRPRP